MQLIREFSPVAYDFALASWGWLGISDQVPRFASSFGDMFLESRAGWWFLDTVEGTLEMCWRTTDEMFGELQSADGRAEYLLEGTLGQALGRGMTLSDDEVFAFIPAPAITGTMDADSLTPLRFAIAASLAGRIHHELRLAATPTLPAAPTGAPAAMSRPAPVMSQSAMSAPGMSRPATAAPVMSQHVMSQPVTAAPPAMAANTPLAAPRPAPSPGVAHFTEPAEPSTVRPYTASNPAAPRSTAAPRGAGPRPVEARPVEERPVADSLGRYTPPSWQAPEPVGYSAPPRTAAPAPQAPPPTTRPAQPNPAPSPAAGRVAADPVPANPAPRAEPEPLPSWAPPSHVPPETTLTGSHPAAGRAAPAPAPARRARHFA